jgi:hypothetical protein
MRQLLYLIATCSSFVFCGCVFLGEDKPDYPTETYYEKTFKWYGTMHAFTSLQGNSPCYGVINPCTEGYNAYIKLNITPLGRWSVSYLIDDRIVRTFEVYSSDIGSSSDNPLSWQSVTYIDEYNNIIRYSVNYYNNYYRLPPGCSVTYSFPFSSEQEPGMLPGIWNLFLPI